MRDPIWLQNYYYYFLCLFSGLVEEEAEIWLLEYVPAG